MSVADPATFDPRALLATCRQRLAAFMVPRYVEVVAGFDTSAATGKIRKAVLRERGVTAATWDRRAGRT